MNEGLSQESAETEPARVELAQSHAAETEPAEPAEEALATGLGGELAEAEPTEEGGPGWDAEDESRDVSPLAVVGIILGVIALVGVAVGVLAVVTHGFRPNPQVVICRQCCNGH